MKNKAFVPIIFFGFIGFLIWAQLRANRVEEDIEHNGKTGIGQYVSYRRYPKSEDNYFEFYINNKMYKENAGRAPSGFKDNRGKFYKIIYSEKYPGCFKVIFDEQITDTLKILEAGFSKDDFY